MLVSIWSLAVHELRMTVRGRAGLSVIIAACLLAFIDAALHTHSPLVAGVRASMFGCGIVLVPLSLVFVAASARRDETVGAEDVVSAHTFPADLLFVARFLGNYAAALFAYVMVIVAALLVPLLTGKLASPLTFVHALQRGAVPLLFVVAVGYCGVTLARNALAAAVVAVYWLFVQLWGDFLARIFNFSLTQNWPTYGALALGLVLGTAAIRRYQEVGAAEQKRSVVLPSAAVVLLAFALVNAWQRVSLSHDRPLRRDPFALQLASQYAAGSARAPAFWLPDQRGRQWRLSSTDGDVVVLLFWSPHVPTSLASLDCLQTALEKSGDGITGVAVCLADDHALSPHVAREGRYRFTMVTDTGTKFSPKLKECAPLAEVFGFSALPALYVTDRGRRLLPDLSLDAVLYPAALQETLERARAKPVPPGIGVERP